MSAQPEKWCEACGSTVKGAHKADCSFIDAKSKIVDIAPEPEKPEKTKKPAHSRMSVTIRFTDNDPEIDMMKALSHVMDYCIKRGSLNQRQIDRIGNWFIDKYLDEIKWP